MMERLTEKRDGQNVIPLRQDGKNIWALTVAGMEYYPTQFLYGVYADKLAEYEDFEEIFRAKMTDTACEFLKDKEEFGKWLDRNKWITKKCDEWVRAEEQGLLLRLPCRIGDIIYEPTNRNTINEYMVTGIKEEAFALWIEWKLEKGFVYQSIYGVEVEDIGKTVFLTKEEAEQKLKEMESD